MDKKQVLSILLESKKDVLQEFFDKGTKDIDVKDAKKDWLSFRKENGFGSYGDLLTYTDGQHKLKKSKIYTVEEQINQLGYTPPHFPPKINNKYCAIKYTDVVSALKAGLYNEVGCNGS